MTEQTLTCIECPIGCTITVKKDGDKLEISGNGCPRGKLYAENEVKCPVRVLTTTVKTVFGKPLPVKTEAPVKKALLFDLVKKANGITVDKKLKAGDIVCENFSEGINLIATDDVY